MKMGIHQDVQNMAPSNDTERNDDPARISERARYESPVLRSLGDIREMTLGGSLGTGDSGSAATQRF